MPAASRPSRGDTISWLRDLLGERLSIGRDAIEPDERLSRYGLNSLGAAAIAAEIGTGLGRVLPPTLIWEHPTLRRLAAFRGGTEDEAARPPPAPLAASDAIAIIGLACRLPGANSPAAFWDMLCAGTDAVREVPPARWPIETLYNPDPFSPGHMATRWGGFIDDTARFAADFFGMSPRKAAQADPQQRLALELAWEAFEDGGIRPSRFAA